MMTASMERMRESASNLFMMGWTSGIASCRRSPVLPLTSRVARTLLSAASCPILLLIQLGFLAGYLLKIRDSIQDAGVGAELGLHAIFRSKRCFRPQVSDFLALCPNA